MNKIKEFFMKLFGKKQKMLDEAKKEENINIETNTKEDFINNLKSKYENKEETEKLNLFQMFRAKKIKEEDLTKEQYDQISEMYDKKIAEEKKKIEYLDKKLAKLKKEA